MKQLPLITVLALTLGILAWNFSFYGDFYRAQSGMAGVRAGDAAQPVRPLAPGAFERAAGRQAPAAGADGEQRLATPDRGTAAEDGARRPAGQLVDGTQAGSGSARPVTLTYADGRRKAEGLLLNGRRVEKWAEYWEDGSTVLAVGEYVDGQRDGRWEFFYPEGRVRSVGEYLQGARDGRWVSYHRGGEPMSEGAYSAAEGGERTGRWTLYYTDGSIMEQGEYVRGVRQGHWVFLDPEGREGSRTGNYVDGVKPRD